MVHSDASVSVPSQSEINRWRATGEYLPEFMRDFHDQKDLFKALDEVMQRSIAKNGGLYMRDLSWSDAHVYSVDILLWVMAGHGYTLQRTRKRMAFHSIYDFISEAKARARDASAKMLSAFIADSAEDRSVGTERSVVHNQSAPGEDGEALRERVARLERLLKQRDRLAANSTKFWVRAAKAAMAGDMRELRNRVDMAEAPPADAILSALQQPHVSKP